MHQGSCEKDATWAIPKVPSASRPSHQALKACSTKSSHRLQQPTKQSYSIYIYIHICVYVYVYMQWHSILKNQLKLTAEWFPGAVSGAIGWTGLLTLADIPRMSCDCRNEDGYRQWEIVENHRKSMRILHGFQWKSGRSISCTVGTVTGRKS